MSKFLVQLKLLTKPDNVLRRRTERVLRSVPFTSQVKWGVAHQVISSDFKSDLLRKSPDFRAYFPYSQLVPAISQFIKMPRLASRLS